MDRELEDGRSRVRKGEKWSNGRESRTGFAPQRIRRVELLSQVIQRGYRQQVAGVDATDPLLVNDQQRFRGQKNFGGGGRAER